MISKFNPALEFSPSERTIPNLLEVQAARFSERDLYSCGDTSLSYRELRDLSARYAGRLSEAGIQKGDRIALMATNRSEFMPLFLACAWIGAISVPINVAARGFQLQHMLTNCAARMLVIEADILHVLNDLDTDKLSIERAWVLGSAGEFSTPSSFALEPLPSPGKAVDPAIVAPQDTLTILYTSGTTGLSKGVICPHAQFFWWGVYTGRQLGVVERDVLHTPLPLFHTNALNSFFQALLHGASQVVERRFSVSGFWPAVSRSGATVTYLLGAMVPMLLSRPRSDVERDHTIRVALAPGVPAAASEEFRERTGIVLLDGFGTTESNAVIISTVDARRPGWAGRLSNGFEAIIVDEDDTPLPDGEAGELLLRATEPFSMANGYYAMPEKTVEAWRNLWLHTGDRLVRTPDGYFRFIDRMKDAIRRRGENISSYEVEQVLMAHPAVALAAVFPVASHLAEDEVMAAIVLREGHTLEPADLIHFCEGKMSYFAVPRFLDFVTELPKTENGKIQKFKLREKGRTQSTWDREVAGIALRRQM